MTEDLLRVGDAERHHVGELLARHFADGRLDQAELDERLGQAMAAKTRADLAGLLVDLPRLAEPPPAAPARRCGAVCRLTALALALLFLLVMAASMIATAHVSRAVRFRTGAIPARLLPVIRPITPPSSVAIPRPPAHPPSG